MQVQRIMPKALKKSFVIDYLEKFAVIFVEIKILDMCMYTHLSQELQMKTYDIIFSFVNYFI